MLQLSVLTWFLRLDAHPNNNHFTEFTSSFYIALARVALTQVHFTWHPHEDTLHGTDTKAH